MLGQFFNLALNETEKKMKKSAQKMKNQTKSVKNRNLNVYRVSTHDRRSKHTAVVCAHENKTSICIFFGSFYSSKKTYVLEALVFGATQMRLKQKYYF
jgi:hypothetical protein